MNYELARILELCYAHGWSRYRLAKEMEVPPNGVYNLFRRGSAPTIPILRDICAALGVTLAEFYGGGDIRLSKDQGRVLRAYSALNEVNQARAEAYIRGLIDGQE